MHLSLSAGGSPASTRTALRAQLEAQLGTACPPQKANVGSAVMEYVNRELMGVPETASVSVSVSLTIGIHRPTA